MGHDKSRTAAFSGHRSFKTNAGSLFADPRSQADEVILERLCETVRALSEEGFTDFLCGMAEGFDLLAAEAVVALRNQYPHLKLIAVIPFPEQPAGFGDALRARYERILAASDGVVTISPAYSADCFHRRNDWLVDHASTLVCYYNGSKGGTQYTVRRALKNGLRIINLRDRENIF